MSTDPNPDTTIEGQAADPSGTSRSQAISTPKAVEIASLDRLAAMSQADYDRVRKEEAKSHGVQTKTLDDMVKAHRKGGRAEERGPFTEREPAPQAVDPANLLDAVAAVIRRFVVLDPEQADAAALWVVHTYLTEASEVSPLAIINAPERACAKTLFQTVLGKLVYRPLPASNASLSALFRSVERWHPTILVDEADTFFKENAELHGMINAGYKRGGYILRSEASGDNFEPRMFSVYGAKSIAGISLERHLPDSTLSRGIVFGMRRKLPHESVERLRTADPAGFDRLASQIARFALDHEHRLRVASPKLPEALNDREQDNWEPLFAIAECAGPHWIERATAAALKLSGAGEVVASTGNELLADIKEIFDGIEADRIKGARIKGDRIKTVELLEKLTADDEKAWATYNRGRPMTPRQLAKMLDAYGIKPKTVRMAEKDTPKGYDQSQFEDAFARYLQPRPDAPAGKVVEQPAEHEPECDVADTPQPSAALQVLAPDAEPDFERVPPASSVEEAPGPKRFPDAAY
jgi:putative DNA primase/helicase